MVDLDHLRRQSLLLSDEALEAESRRDLVPEAKAVIIEEQARRKEERVLQAALKTVRERENAARANAGLPPLQEAKPNIQTIPALKSGMSWCRWTFWTLLLLLIPGGLIVVPGAAASVLVLPLLVATRIGLKKNHKEAVWLMTAIVITLTIVMFITWNLDSMNEINTTNYSARTVFAVFKIFVWMFIFSIWGIFAAIPAMLELKNENLISLFNEPSQT